MPPASDTDGRAIISSIQAIEPTILDALKGITAKKAAFQALPVDGITTFIRQDLANLGASTSAFESALIASAPVRLEVLFGSYGNAHTVVEYRPASYPRPSNSRPPSMQPSLLPLQLMLEGESVDEHRPRVYIYSVTYQPQKQMLALSSAQFEEKPYGQ